MAGGRNPDESKALPGQGTDLPADFPYEGQWIIENQLFLYRSKDVPALGIRAEITPTVSLANGKWCFGLDAMQLSFQLGIEIQQIFVENRNGNLIFASWEDVGPTTGGTFAKRYTFRCGSKLASVTIEGGGTDGRA